MGDRSLFWKFLLIFAVVVAAIGFAYPPEESISLGLDLQGGSHILMQVDTGSALDYQMGLTQSYLGNRLEREGLVYDAIVLTDQTTVELHGTDPAKRAEVREALDEVVGNWNISELGSGSWRVSMPTDARVYHEATAIDMLLDTLRTRIDGLGVSEPLVQQQDEDRILIQLPGVENPERVQNVLKDPALLEWKQVTYPPATDADFPPDSRQALLAMFRGALPDDTDVFEQHITDLKGDKVVLYWPLKRVSTIVGDDLRNAYRTTNDYGLPAVSFELTQEAGKRFEAATKKNIGKRMAILLGSSDTRRVISAPVIRGEIRDSGIIEGGFDVESAEDLALKLRSGAFPARVEIIEERTVGPSLGRDSIKAGLTAGIAGFLGVLLFMVVYYRLAGINAVVALAMNILLVFGALGALPTLLQAKATLTLPGIAGLILTVGMAVDSNVLIFERIREELRLGKTVRAAVDQGFGKAFTTILDCNVTTLVAAFFLFSYGTGPVRGFAVTLTIGLLASMFTAVFVSRQLFELILSRKGRGESLSI